jgi:hypothetical protein
MFRLSHAPLVPADFDRDAERTVTYPPFRDAERRTRHARLIDGPPGFDSLSHAAFR